MESSDADDVQRRLFEDTNTNSPLNNSSLDVPPASNGVSTLRAPESTASRSFVSTAVVLAVVVALGATYVVEMSAVENIQLSAPTQLAVVSLLWGVASFAFTWWYTYFDSHDPGSFPTSPLKLAAPTDSSHTPVQWHFSYIMAPVNGIVAMLLYIYWKLVWLVDHADRRS